MGRSLWRRAQAGWRCWPGGVQKWIHKRSVLRFGDESWWQSVVTGDPPWFRRELTPRLIVDSIGTGVPGALLSEPSGYLGDAMTEQDQFLAEIQASIAQADAVIQRGLQIERDAQAFFNSLGVEPEVLLARLAEKISDADRVRLDRWVSQQLDLPLPPDPAGQSASLRSVVRKLSRSMA